MIAKHSHVATRNEAGELLDVCGACGKDLRDPVHVRVCPVCGREYTERQRRKAGHWAYRHYGYEGPKWCQDKALRILGGG